MVPEMLLSNQTRKSCDASLIPKTTPKVEWNDSQIREDVATCDFPETQEKLSLFTIDMMIYIQDPEGSTKTIPRNNKRIQQSGWLPI